jgi:peroxiredoxin
LQAVLPEIESLGASLIVLSPQLQEFTKAGAERHKLTFPILTDLDNKVGEAYGLAFRLPDDLIAVYEANGIDLAKFNGDESWRLSMPARIVIQRDGIVVSAEADPDYTRRPEPEDTLAALRGIQRRRN